MARRFGLTSPVSSAIVTGAGHGIRRATVLRLGEEGYRVVVAEVEPQRGERVAEDLSPTRHSLRAVEFAWRPEVER